MSSTSSPITNYWEITQKALNPLPGPQDQHYITACQFSSRLKEKAVTRDARLTLCILVHSEGPEPTYK